MDVIDPQSFEEFWPYYVSQHRDPTCRRLHFVGTTAALGLVATAPLFPPALLAAPVAGYGLAWIGHLVFEKNRPASWHSARHFRVVLARRPAHVGDDAPRRHGRGGRAYRGRLRSRAGVMDRRRVRAESPGRSTR